MDWFGGRKERGGDAGGRVLIGGDSLPLALSLVSRILTTGKSSCYPLPAAVSVEAVSYVSLSPSHGAGWPACAALFADVSSSPVATSDGPCRGEGVWRPHVRGFKEGEGGWERDLCRLVEGGGHGIRGRPPWARADTWCCVASASEVYLVYTWAARWRHVRPKKTCLLFDE